VSAAGPPGGLIVDMDGVLYRGESPMPGLSDFFAVVHDHPYVLVTNNSTVSAADCAAKLERMGVDVAETAVLTVSEATARYLVSALPAGGRALVLGSPALKQAVAREGVEMGGDEVEAVVVGLDVTFDYAALAKAATMINRGAAFVATSLDPVLLTEDGTVPGTGALVAAICACVRASPVCVGKPSPAMFEVAASALGLPPADTLVIGDNLRSDIGGGAAVGARTALLLSGVTLEDEAADGVPDFVFEGLPALTAFLVEAWAR
jgi:4-nitrophenyl phosphatase